MGPIIAVGELRIRNREVREQLLVHFQKIAAYGRANEPGTLKYCMFVPRDRDDAVLAEREAGEGESIWAYEEYDSVESQQKHLESDAVKELMGLTTANPDWILGPPDVHNFQPRDDPGLVHAHGSEALAKEATTDSNPFTILALITVAPADHERWLAQWRAVVADMEANEPNAYFYQVLEAKDERDVSEGLIPIIEVYKSKEVWEAEHVSQASVQELIKMGWEKEHAGQVGVEALARIGREKEAAGRTKVLELDLRAGFFGRD